MTVFFRCDHLTMNNPNVLIPAEEHPANIEMQDMSGRSPVLRFATYLHLSGIECKSIGLMVTMLFGSLALVFFTLLTVVRISYGTFPA